MRSIPSLSLHFPRCCCCYCFAVDDDVFNLDVDGKEKYVRSIPSLSLHSSEAITALVLNSAAAITQQDKYEQALI